MTRSQLAALYVQVQSTHRLAELLGKVDEARWTAIKLVVGMLDMTSSISNYQPPTPTELDAATWIHEALQDIQEVIHAPDIES